MSAVTVGVLNLDLTGMERTVLAYLLLNTCSLVSKADLTAAAYPAGAIAPASNSIEVIVSRLRKTIAAAGAEFRIETRRGRGYILQPICEVRECAPRMMTNGADAAGVPT